MGKDEKEVARDGRERGYAEVRKEHSAQLEAMAAFVHAARDKLEQDIAGLTELGVEIVFQAIMKIVGQLGTDREGIAAIVREADMTQRRAHRVRDVCSGSPNEPALAGEC